MFEKMERADKMPQLGLEPASVGDITFKK